MNPCEEFELLISARLDGELLPEEEAKLDAHLSQCPHCQALAQEMQALEESIAQVAQPLPQALKDRLANQNWSQIPQSPPLPQDPKPQEQAPKKKFSRRRLSLVACSAAAVILLVVATCQLLLPIGRTGSSSPSIFTIFPWGDSQAAISGDSNEGSDAPPASSEAAPGESEGNRSDGNSAGDPGEGAQTYGDEESHQKNDTPTPDPNEGATGNEGAGPGPNLDAMTMEAAQSYLSGFLTSHGRHLTLTPSGLVGDTWVFIGKDDSGRTVATFSVSRTTGQILETPVSDGTPEEQDLSPNAFDDGPGPTD